MGDPFKKVQPGARMKIPAEAFNAFIDAARDYKMRQRSQGVGDLLAPLKQTGIVPVRNETGSDRERFDIVGLKSPVILPTDNAQEFQNRPAFIAETPSRGGHIGRFAILQEPCANGAIVPAVVSGITIARVNVLAEWHERADIQTNGFSELVSGEVGSATILWKEPGLGTSWAIIRLDDFVVDEFWARLGAATSVSPNRWKYSFAEVVKSGAGYGSWTPGGFNRTGEAFNSVEDPNDGQGLEGNGIDIDALSQCVCGDSSSSGEQSCCRLLPAGMGAIVRMKEVRFGNGSQPQVEYWFAYENEVDCCSEGSSSSESSSSDSSSSESSSSDSSSESSSGSSESSSSDSSSSGSSESSSSAESSSSEVSSSESSSSGSESSSSSSSASSGSGDSGSGEPCNCITIITNVSLDENGCLTITSREICVPVDCPMGDEYTYTVCPTSSSSGSGDSSGSSSEDSSSSGSGDSSGSSGDSSSSETSSSADGSSSGSSGSSSSSGSDDIPCDDCQCTWVWTGSSWQQIVDCNSPYGICNECICLGPPGPGYSVGEQADMPCE